MCIGISVEKKIVFSKHGAETIRDPYWKKKKKECWSKLTLDTKIGSKMYQTKIQKLKV